MPPKENDLPALRLLRDPILVVLLLASLILLLLHARAYSFLTDDAFISFRYARNLALGHGLVFNPGFERVEGYTNFLWVVVLALLRELGAAPEDTAPVLGLLETAVLWGVVAAFALRGAETRRERLLSVVPPFLLAITRSFAVWSTGGLETRLFELLVVAGVLRLVVEDERLERGDAAPWPFAALLLGLGTLTRPDGLLVSASVLGTATLLRWRGLRARVPWIARSAATFGVLVGGHLLFRRSYYGEWLPNTYYAKVDGMTWWSMGARYLASFVLEYAVFLWVPLLVVGVLYHRRRRTTLVPALVAAAVVPHAVYIASIGGDHFEYRPIDLYLPLLFLLVGAGVVHLSRSRRSTSAVAAYLLLVAVGIVEIPYRSHVQSPSQYVVGFPGQALGRSALADTFLDPGRSPIFGLPGLRVLARWHQALVRSMTSQLVAIRQEEHALFLGTTIEEARGLRRLIDGGEIPADTYIAVECVGAIPYYTDLRVLDRLGLTDAHVARGPFVYPNIMAHGKRASREYAREAGVDLWPEDSVHLLWRRDNPRLLRKLSNLYPLEPERYFADVGDGQVLLAWFPRGPEATLPRFPRLRFHGTHDVAALRRLAAEPIREGKAPETE